MLQCDVTMECYNCNVTSVMLVISVARIWKSVLNIRRMYNMIDWHALLASRRLRCRLVHLLRHNVAAGCATWTNNGWESVNHVLKSAVEWCPRKIPDLIQTLHRLVESQFVDADRALMVRGEFALKPQYAKHRLTVDNWQRMSTARRDSATYVSDYQAAPVSSPQQTEPSLHARRWMPARSHISASTASLQSRTWRLSAGVSSLYAQTMHIA